MTNREEMDSRSMNGHSARSRGGPAVLAILAMLTEFLGAIALFLGCLTRIAAFAIEFDMLVAALLVHVHYGWLRPSRAQLYCKHPGLQSE